MKRLATALIITLLAAGAQTRSDADHLLKAAQNAELVDGNLNAAIKQYGAIVSKFAKNDRGIAAMALVRMADCYRKMGDAESRRLYERVMREYADQKEAVAMAKAGLGRRETGSRTTATLVWSGSDVDTEGTVSYDGRYLSYTDWDTGDLGVREIAAGQNRHVTDTGQKQGRIKDFAEKSAVSRDGKQVAYSWWNENNGKRWELRIASLTGDPNPRRLYDNPAVDWLMPADWSPDGKWVAVRVNLKDKNHQIGVVSVPDGALRVLKTGRWRGISRMFFSPDGKYLGYDLPQGGSGPDRDVFVMELETAREIPVVVHRA